MIKRLRKIIANKPKGLAVAYKDNLEALILFKLLSLIYTLYEVLAALFIPYTKSLLLYLLFSLLYTSSDLWFLLVLSPRLKVRANFLYGKINKKKQICFFYKAAMRPGYLRYGDNTNCIKYIK
uniref:hypothetical protein n=1 Tax=Dematophora necatrix TaxID=2751867 RepID=UPI0030E2DD01